MSNVTNVILSDDSLRGDQLIDKIQDQLGVIRIDPLDVGGTKCLENNLYIGAFNYLIMEDFIRLVRDVYNNVETVDRDDVQLLVKTQDDCKWREVEWR